MAYEIPTTRYTDLFEFIKEVKLQYGFCEAIINKDGTVNFALPSHQDYLIYHSGISRDLIFKLMPVTESPLHWLTSLTGMVAVWGFGALVPNDMTEAQGKSLKNLIDNRIIKNAVQVAKPHIINPEFSLEPGG